MRNFLSLLLALLILLVFGGTAFFLWNVSSGAKFERKDQKESPVLVQPSR